MAYSIFFCLIIFCILQILVVRRKIYLGFILPLFVRFVSFIIDFGIMRNYVYA